LDFIATDDTMQALYDADPRGTAWIPVQDGLTDDPQVQTFAASAANGIPMPNIPQMGSVWGPLGDNMLLIRNGEIDAAEAMTTAAEAVRAAVAG
ncbi:MAG: maltose ABC transporter substrate-binding protein, partial [Ilumatobacteraceae bacterium]